VEISGALVSVESLIKNIKLKICTHIFNYIK